jgi:hypothetical protein
LKLKVFIFGLILAVGAVYFWADPGSFSFFPRCIFKMLTGWDCAACGTQRALHAFLHGRISEGLSYNYFLLIALPILLAVALTEHFFPPAWQRKCRRVLYHRALILTLGLLTIAWTFWRNIA